MGCRTERTSPFHQRLIIQLVLIIVTVTCVYPLFWLVITSLKGQAGYLADKFAVQWPLHFENFVAAFRGGRFVRWFLNSVIITALSTVISTIVAAFSAFVFAKMPFRGSRLLLNSIIALMVVPPVVMITPLFVMYTQLHLHSTFQGITLIYVGLVLPFSVYMLTNFFRTIPQELIEAAFIDGYNRTRVLLKIFIPLSGPAITTLIITNALWIWNELLVALTFLAKDAMRTLVVGITAFRTRYMLDVPVTMAGLLLTVIPMLVLYAVFQKSFIRGLTEGSVKG